MKCFHCEQIASAVCQFCGRAACREHVEGKKKFFSGFKAFGGMLSMEDCALEVPNAIWCGICHVEYRASS